MPRSSLGKRTRSVVEKEVDLVIETPRKRSRRSTAKYSIEDTENDENYDPNSAKDEVDEDDIYVPASKVSTRLKVSPSKPIPVTPQTPRFRNALSRSPATPRHAVMSAGKLFKRADAGELVGRESERGQLNEFMERLGSPNPSGCLYVSGPPGTGKSAMVQETTKQASSTTEVKYSYINCMSIKSSKDLYVTLLDALDQSQETSTEAEAMKCLQGMFIQRKKSAQTFLVILDEIDHILTMGLESLYRMFEWSLQKSSRLTLIGIANALDLTDRFLPRLKSKNLKPDLLPFLPYTAPQIKNIILTRLKSLVPADSNQPGYVPFIHPAAVELCSRKVTAAAFSNGTNQRLKTLNLQQKAALCALVAFEKRNRASQSMNGTETPSKSSNSLAPTVKMLFDAYCRLCKSDSVLHPSQARSEEKRVASCVGEEEAEQATDGVGAGILKSILNGDALEY
ncbi:unnamed protein product [Parascedosporium putredinis]|uniref:Cell division control protein n=1 Tax=Parascedosporium putredinis TaxID=1442378 RepID=A0A9P1H5I3_9PEZI|nr:unnamed protein product [Parascedosporium putredinis]CAI7997981.1 unnamed protein product [Parascedosporium putredinis]